MNVNRLARVSLIGEKEETISAKREDAWHEVADSHGRRVSHLVAIRWFERNVVSVSPIMRCIGAG